MVAPTPILQTLSQIAVRPAALRPQHLRLGGPGLVISTRRILTTGTTLLLFTATVDSKKLENGPETVYAGFPSSLGFGFAGPSYSSFLASTATPGLPSSYRADCQFCRRAPSPPESPMASEMGSAASDQAPTLED